MSNKDFCAGFIMTEHAASISIQLDFLMPYVQSGLPALTASEPNAEEKKVKSVVCARLLYSIAAHNTFSLDYWRRYLEGKFLPLHFVAKLEYIMLSRRHYKMI